tara:strand:+ start:98169 stop:99329 length:1161 start_codon:yes stop_codon:yes gene_type:complete
MQHHDDLLQYADTADVLARLQPAEPLYLFCRQALAERAQQFLTQFCGKVSYAVKANPEPRVLRTLLSAGITHFDVASISEIASVHALAPGARLHFNNPVKARAAVKEAYQRYGVRSYALDEQSELEKILQATDSDPEVMYSVRFKLAHQNASYDFGSKFGCHPREAVALLRAINRAGARAALTFHPGSQCTDPAAYSRYLKVAADIMAEAQVPIAQINVGGGFPEYYRNTAAPSLVDYFDHLRQARDHSFSEPVPLMCEPGRAMVAPSTSLLVSVVHVRQDQQTVFINDGLYGGMQEQSLVDLQLPARVWRQGMPYTGNPQHYRIFGPTCDPVDRLPRDIALPGALVEGDIIEFGLLGAYGSATATAFNGFGSGTYCNVQRGYCGQ